MVSNPPIVCPTHDIMFALCHTHQRFPTNRKITNQNIAVKWNHLKTVTMWRNYTLILLLWVGLHKCLNLSVKQWHTLIKKCWIPLPYTIFYIHKVYVPGFCVRVISGIRTWEYVNFDCWTYNKWPFVQCRMRKRKRSFKSACEVIFWVTFKRWSRIFKVTLHVFQLKSTVAWRGRLLQRIVRTFKY